MATQSDVRALAFAHAHGDKERFRATLLQIAAGADNAGHYPFANEMRRLADTETKIIGGQFIELPRGSSDMLFSVSPKMTLADVILKAVTSEPILEFVRQYQNRDKLIDHGLPIPRKLLFTGPPGVGKTVTAGAIAKELGLPLLLVQLHSIVASHLGDTAKNIRKVFDAVKMTPGVYLLDEFDALAGKRKSGAESADAELNRGLNSLLQFMEEEGEGIIIATTNMETIIDPAMFRRFDVVVDFKLPGWLDILKLIKRTIERAGLTCVEDSYSAKDYNRSHADIEAKTINLCRTAVLDGRGEVKLSEVI